LASRLQDNISAISALPGRRQSLVERPRQDLHAVDCTEPQALVEPEGPGGICRVDAQRRLVHAAPAKPSHRTDDHRLGDAAAAPWPADADALQPAVFDAQG